MECVNGALKFSPQICFDENGCLNAQNIVSGDDFFVDELLDLSNEEEFVEEEDEKPAVSVSVSGQELQETAIVSGEKACFSAVDELSVPAEDLEDLEWLSHFVEDSFSEFSAPFPAGIPSPQPKKSAGVRPGNIAGAVFKTPVPVKARTKRARTGGRVWSLRSPPDSPASSSSSSPVTEKPRKKPATERHRSAAVFQPTRRCSHCGVQKTPQWRTGPLGAKTLCNACGVRFKSGRLLPEYRPACSPTFSSELHSNHHRKVLEMRRSKETAGVTGSDLGSPAVTSF